MAIYFFLLKLHFKFSSLVTVATFQVLISHVRLVVTRLDLMVVDYKILLRLSTIGGKFGRPNLGYSLIAL